MIDVYDYDNGDGFMRPLTTNDTVAPKPIVHLKDGNVDICALVGAGIHLYSCARCGGIYAWDCGKDITSAKDCPYCGSNNMRISMKEELEFINVLDVPGERIGSYCGDEVADLCPYCHDELIRFFFLMN